MGIVRHGVWGTDPRPPASLERGELVWARIINGIENPLAMGKVRPVILVEAQGWQWKTMGLTTNPRYRDGSPRLAIPDHSVVGLRAPGWLWGTRLTWVSGIDIDDHIGWIDRPLALEVIALAHLGAETSLQLLDAAKTHHGPAAGPQRSARPRGAA